MPDRLKRAVASMPAEAVICSVASRLGATFADGRHPDQESKARDLRKQGLGRNESNAEAGSCRERDDNYRHVIIQLCEQWRVIDCKDRMQWILQRRDAARPHRGFWRGRLYHLTRVALIASCVALAGLSEGPALDQLARLPDNHPRGGRHE